MRIQFSAAAGNRPSPLSAGVLPSLTWAMPAISIIAIASLLVAGSTASAHHSARAFFDTGNMGEIEGEVTGTHWRNPHVEFQVQVTGEDGAQETWTIESNSVNALERIGITSDMIEVGDRVVFWGAMSRLGRPSMRGYNVLLSTGQEVLMMPPHLHGTTLGRSGVAGRGSGSARAGYERGNRAGRRHFPRLDARPDPDREPLAAPALGDRSRPQGRL